MSREPRERLGYRCLGTGTEIYLRRILSISAIFALAEIPVLVGFLLEPTRPPGLGGWTRWSEVLNEVVLSFSARTGLVVLSMALQFIGTAVVLLGVFHALDRTPISLAESARRGLRRIVPLMGTGLAVAAVVLYATMLYVVPGLLAMLYMSLAVAICAAERASPLRALGRSGDLAGLGLGPLLVIVLVTFVLPRALEVWIGVALRSEPGLAAAIVIPVHVVMSGLGATLLAVAYRELRRIKDGSSDAALIAAFD